jgi:addiction module RelE/StbE family toxin
VKRLLLPTKAFLRSAQRLARKNPDFQEDLRFALNLLSTNALDPRLKSHKLKGRLKGSWACSAGYDLRIIFQYVQHKNREVILLEAAGTRDEIY